MSADVKPPASGLWRNASYWGLLYTQFLGAFNDNVFKQLMLLLAIPVALTAVDALQESAAEITAKDQQGLATFLFSLPFVLFSGYAGYLSDRYSKRTIVVLSKIAEIFVMLLGLFAFLFYNTTGFTGLLVVLFLMGTQSAFFGPPKYGVLPQLVDDKDLPRANGLILMTTFLAIIFGVVVAGILGKLLKGASDDATRLWMGSFVCIGLAIAGTLTSLRIRPLPAQSPDLKFHWDALGIPRDTRLLLKADRPLLMSLLVSSLFWLVSGLAMQAVNSLGKVQLGLDDFYTSLLPAFVAIGIMVGSVISGTSARDSHDLRFVSFGGWGIFLSLIIISISLPTSEGWQHLLGYWGTLPLLAVLGMAAGMFAVPVQVFLQTRPPAELKGRMIAVMNLVNFIAIMLSGVIYSGMDDVAVWLRLPRSVIFMMIAVLMLPVVLRKNGGLGEVSEAGELPVADSFDR